MLDTACSVSLIKRRAAEKLSLEGEECTLQLAVAAQKETVRSNEQEVVIQLVSLKGDFTTPCIKAITCKVCISPLPKVTIDPSTFPHLQEIEFTEKFPQKIDSEIDLLLDSNTTMSLFLQSNEPQRFHGPKAVNTKLGWVLCGEENEQSNSKEQTPKVIASVIGAEQQESEHMLYQRFFSLEDIGIRPQTESKYSAEDEMAMKLMKEGTTYDEKNRRFTVKLLFKCDPRTALDSHYPVARRMAISSRQKVIKGGVIKEVDKAVREMVEMDAAEYIPPEEIRVKDRHYLPTTFAFKEKSESTTAIRVCQNASSECKITKKSLNSCLLQGPVSELMPDLVALVLRIKLSPHILLCDVSKQFWNIKVHPDHRDWLRFLYASEHDEEPRELRMKSLSMGAISSPFQAMYVVRELCRMYRDEFPDAVEAIHDTLYVDDVCHPVDTIAEGARVARQLVQLFQRASMRVHKFRASSDEILDRAQIRPDSRSAGEVHKILGVQWHVASDTFQYNFEEAINATGPPTKRSMLKLVSSIFDPLGSCSAIIFKAKVLIQQAWKLNLKWDQPLEGDLLKDWLKWKSALQDMHQLTQPRLILPKIERGKAWLAATSDASQMGIGVNVYVVLENQSQLLYSRSRVAPIKSTQNMDSSLSIVRLELLSILCAARIIDYIKTSVGEAYFSKVRFFSDSLINCHRVWKNNPGAYKQWVSSRLTEIGHRMNPSQLRWIPGAVNSADWSSRGAYPIELKDNSLWNHGAAFFLREEHLWPSATELTTEENTEMDRLDKAECKTKVEPALAAAIIKICQPLNPFHNISEKISSFPKITRIIAYVFRFLLAACPKLKTKTQLFKEAEEGRKGNITLPEIRLATLFLLRAEQRKVYEKEMELRGEKLCAKKGSSLQAMGCFEDSNGLWRVTTRLSKSKTIGEEGRHPILLPKDNGIVNRLLLHLHQVNGHLTISNLLYHAQRVYFVKGGRKQLQKVLRLCRQRGCQKPRQMRAVTPPLPEVRTQVHECFKNIGLDFFGAIKYRSREKSCDCPVDTELKGYGLLISCMYSRAVHVEFVRSQSTWDFLNAFTKYTAIRGVPDTIFSDNSLTLKQASRELKRIYRQIDWNQVQNEMTKRSIEWSWSPPKYPASNGCTERLIGLIKRALNSTLKETGNITFAELEALGHQAALYTNDRPLASKTERYDEEDIVTPSLLCHGRLLMPLPFDNKTKLSENVPFTRMMRHRRLLVTKYFKAWRKSYLQATLSTKFCKKGEDPPLKIDMIVLYKDEAMKPKFKMGKIVELHRSTNDNQIRRVSLKIPTGSIIQRHLNAISLLPADLPADWQL